VGHSDSCHAGAVHSVLHTESLDLVDGGQMSYGKGRWHCERCQAKFESRWELILHEEQVHKVSYQDAFNESIRRQDVQH